MSDETEEWLIVVREPGWSVNPNKIRTVKPEDDNA